MQSSADGQIIVTEGAGHQCIGIYHDGVHDVCMHTGIDLHADLHMFCICFAYQYVEVY